MVARGSPSLTCLQDEYAAVERYSDIDTLTDRERLAIE